ncbi:MAG: polyprenyl diphosphate synthase [Pseudomonadota bacterium]
MMSHLGQISPSLPIPKHVAIIMDGNGRWARDRGLPRTEGHREGAHSVKSVVRAAREVGIKNLTLFAFSEQNWNRPQDEINALMELLNTYVLEERQEILDNQIRLTAIGDLAKLPVFVRSSLNTLIQLSAPNNGMTLCLALSYGGREDILHATRSLAEDVLAKRLQPNQIDEKTFQAKLWTSELPPLDLLIRTGGELRISNFLLWQAAYAELFFSSARWPDFRQEQFLEAITVFQQRERRFGLISDQISSE